MSSSEGSESSIESLLPACLSSQETVSFEIRQSSGEPAHVGLAGYRLRSGQDYLLKLRVPRSPESWSLCVDPPPDFLNAAQDRPSSDGREVSFSIKQNPISHWKSRNSAEIPVRVQANDGTMIARIEIPVLFQLRGLALVAWTTILGIAPTVGGFLWGWQGTLVGIAIAAVFAFLRVGFEWWRVRRRTETFLEALTPAGTLEFAQSQDSLNGQE